MSDTSPDIIFSVRRENALALLQAFTLKETAAGAAAKGMDKAFAASVEMSAVTWSQLKRQRRITDKIARQIESHCSMPMLWLDTPHVEPQPSPARAKFLELAGAAWDASNAHGKRALRTTLMEIVTTRNEATPDGDMENVGPAVPADPPNPLE